MQHLASYYMFLTDWSVTQSVDGVSSC